MQYQDPILHYYNKIAYIHNEVEEIIVGEKYLACKLKNGRLGVCAILNTDFEFQKTIPLTLDPEKAIDRIILNAYYNARLNESREYPETSDIFDKVDFTDYHKIVMIGYFAPLIDKFRLANIKLDVFDVQKKHENLIPMSQQIKFVSEADALIVSATSISNGSFCTLLNASSKQSRVFILGPSSILDPYMLEYYNIAGIFGMTFKDNQDEILKVIADGKGTRSFGKLGRKVYLQLWSSSKSKKD